MDKAFTKYIEESNRIQDGPPACYRLKPVIENLDEGSDREHKLRRFTLGNRNPQKLNKTVLLVGPAGTGKSTLINALVNFVMGVEFEDKIWFEIVQDEKNRPEAQSQTSDVTIYEMFGFEGTPVPYSLTIIDTPGYGGIRGPEYDQMITKKLEDLFCFPKGVDTVDAVGLVLKAPENRLDDRMAYIFNSVTSLFGKDMEKNIVAMATFSDGRRTQNAIEALEKADIKWAKDQNREPVCFLFSNCQKEKITNKKSDERAAKNAFEISEENMKEFTEFLGTSQPQSLKTTVKVIKERIRLEACVQNLKERVTAIEQKQAAIKNNKEELSKNEQKIKKNEHFKIQVEETYKERVEIKHWWDYKAVSCLTCEETCHYPGCTWAWNPYRCQVIKDGKCTSCSGKCPVGDHVKEKWRYVTKTRTVEKTAEEMKAKYEKSKAESEEMTTLLEAMETELAELEQTKARHLDEAFNIIHQLEKIALNVDSVYTYIHLDFLMEKLKELGDSEKVQKLKRMKTKISVYVKAAANYFKRVLWSTDTREMLQDQDSSSTV